MVKVVKSNVFQGYGSEIELKDHGIVIRRKGAFSFALHGLKGDKHIPFSSIAAVQLKAAGLLTSGFIQFSITGGNESRGGIMAATKDENTVFFKGRQANGIFEQLREIVELKSREARSPTTNSSISKAEQLSQLADLLDRGLLTTDEFNVQKAAVIG